MILKVYRDAKTLYDIVRTYIHPIILFTRRLYHASLCSIRNQFTTMLQWFPSGFFINFRITNEWYIGHVRCAHSQLLSISSYLLDSPDTVSLSTLGDILLLTGFPWYGITLNSCRYLLTYWIPLKRYHSQLLVISSYLLDFPDTVLRSALGDIFFLTGVPWYGITLNSWRYLLAWWISLIRYHSQLLSISSLADSVFCSSLKKHSDRGGDTEHFWQAEDIRQAYVKDISWAYNSIYRPLCETNIKSGKESKDFE